MDESPAEKPKSTTPTDGNYQGFSGNDEHPDKPHPATPSGPSVTWSASEFVSHEKSAGWYVLLGLGIGVLALAVYFLTQQDVVSTVVVIVAGIAFGGFAARKPRVLDYAIDESGIHIHKKTYTFSQFRSFSVENDGVINSILLVPIKRMAPGISIYYPPDQEQDILDTLGSYLPHEERPPDRVEKLMRKVRF